VTTVSRQNNDLTDLLVGISQKVSGLPVDLAEQHDHYLYGRSKKDRPR